MISTEQSWRKLGLCQRCVDGLEDGGFLSPTAIQAKGIAAALQGSDVLGTAKTGSGKTLAFLVAALEILHREKWSKQMGLGCLVLSPTRELAFQIFTVLKKIGKYFDFSAGVVFGQKSFKEEAACIGNINVLVCTPGRLLQHLDQTGGFAVADLKVLVIDEVDKMMEMDFMQTLRAILLSLPPARRNLMYTATLTRSVMQLASAYLKEPTVIDEQQAALPPTPGKLKQYYTVCELQHKVNFLHSFLKTHRRAKTIVFMSSYKQVRFIQEAFRVLSPGLDIVSFYGRMRQTHRLQIFEQFTKKKACVMLATDLAARGLDFPAVEWIVHLDCPDCAFSYIHRVGRTARLGNGDGSGKSLLIILPSEVGFLRTLSAEKVPLEQVYSQQGKLTDVSASLAAFCAKDARNHDFATKCILAYVKWVHLQRDKRLFNVAKLPLQEFAKSLGLAHLPHHKLIPTTTQPATGFVQPETDEDADQTDLLVPTTTPTDLTTCASIPSEATVARLKTRPISKAKTAKKALKKGIRLNTHTRFDDDAISD